MEGGFTFVYVLFLYNKGRIFKKKQIRQIVNICSLGIKWILYSFLFFNEKNSNLPFLLLHLFRHQTCVLFSQMLVLHQLIKLYHVVERKVD